MSEILITSGLIQVTLAVLMGWPLALLHSGWKQVGPLRHTKRVLQYHLDNVFMGILQMVIATVFPDMPVIAGWLLLIGSWTNPMPFIYMAASTKPLPEQRGMRIFSIISFIIMTTAYLGLVAAWLTR